MTPDKSYPWWFHLVIGIPMLLLGARSIGAETPPIYDLERDFARKLIDRQMYDYAQDQLTHLKQEFRRQEMPNLLVEAELLMAQRKISEATQLLQKIPKDDPAYVDSIVLRTRVLTDPKEKQKAYADYFAAVKQPSTEQEADDYRKMVLRYTQELMDAGEYDKAKESLKLLAKSSAEADEVTQRRIRLKSGQILLAGAEETEDAKKKQVLIKQAIEELRELVWKMDYFSATVYPDLMHAYNLSNEPEEAIANFNNSWELLQNTEKMLREQLGNNSASPVPRALFYLAEAYKTQAALSRETEKKLKDEAEKQLQAQKTVELLRSAAKAYALVFHKYADSRQQAEALNEFSLIGKILEKYYNTKAPEAPGGMAQGAKLKATHELYNKDQYGLAAKGYLEVAAMDLGSQEGAEALSMAAASYRRTMQWWEAMATIDLMIEFARNYERTGDSIYNLGLSLYQEARKTSDPAQAAVLEDLAIEYLTLFVEVSPTHPRAATTAYTIAENQYARASNLRNEAQELEKQNAPISQINSKLETARDAYAMSIPLYESVVQNHAVSENAVKALNKLGWVYQILEQREKAANSFLQYSEKEEEPAKKVAAIYYAADNFLRADNADEAITHFKQVIQLTDKGGQFESVKGDVAKFRELSLTMLPWAYDAKTEQVKRQLARSEQLLVEVRAEEEEKKRLAAEAGDEPAPVVNEGEDDGPKPIGTGMTEEQVKDQIEQIKADLETYRQETIAGLENQRTKRPDAENTPDAMAKLGALYTEMGNFEAAAEVISVLDQKYPETPAGQQALFTLFRAYINIGEIEKAREVAKRMISRLPDYSTNNVVYIATRLFEENKKYEVTVLDPELAFAANDEIIKRADATKPGAADYDQMQLLRQRAFFNRARSLHLMKRYDQAIEAADRYMTTFPQGAYLFDARLLKAIALRDKGDPEAGLAEISEVLKGINKQDLEGTYFRALVEGARALISMNEEARVRQATGMLLPIALVGNAETEEGGKWLEAAYYELARAHALLGNAEKKEEFRNIYLRKYLTGGWRQEISVLPAKRF